MASCSLFGFDEKARQLHGRYDAELMIGSAITRLGAWKSRGAGRSGGSTAQRVLWRSHVAHEIRTSAPWSREPVMGLSSPTASDNFEAVIADGRPEVAKKSGWGRDLRLVYETFEHVGYEELVRRTGEGWV